MSGVLHEIEMKIMSSLRGGRSQTIEGLVGSTGLSADQVRRGTEWLRLKGLAEVKESRAATMNLGRNGAESAQNGLPERRLLDSLSGGAKKLRDIQKDLGPAFGHAVGTARRNGWISVSGDTISIADAPDVLPGEESIRMMRDRAVPETDLPKDDLLSLLDRPGFVVRKVAKTRHVSLTKKGAEMRPSAAAGAIDVEADVPETYVAMTHPLKDVMDEIREVFTALGFSEVTGTMSQSSFWNFDALFTPQDHPARELQDTFYLDGISADKTATASQIRRVSAAHRRGWGYVWDAEESTRMVLRTHTTCVTIRHLAEHRPDAARIFSLGRVFRNEKASYKHLAEFHQVEGVVAGKEATLRNLMGIQKKFYSMMGIDKIKFWPTFFPYTEPSLQTMVYNERLGKWVELFGMGIFRPEVVEPLGIKGPVLAWGGGIERIAMLRYGLDDVRKLYENDLDWLRSAGRCL